MTADPEPRDHALDAARAIAVTLVVALHAAVPYMTVPPPDLLWAVHDRPSPVYDWLFWSANGVSMPLLFLLAGLLSERALTRRGSAAFLRARAKRLGLPFLIGGLAILPVTFYVWAAGWLLQGRCTLEEIRRVKFGPEIQANVYGPAHLWFLEYLILMTLLFVAVRAAAASRGGERRAVRLLRVPVFLALPTVLILTVDPGAATSFRNSFVPDPSRFLHYSWFFAVGVLFAGAGPSIERLVSGFGFRLALAIPFFVAGMSLLPVHLETVLSGSTRLLLAVCLAGFVWLAVLGLLGACGGLFAAPRPLLGRLSRASYWIYVVHFPIVGLVQAALLAAPVGSHLKFPVVFVVALGVSWWSYERFVSRPLPGALPGEPVRRPSRAEASAAGGGRGVT